MEKNWSGLPYRPISEHYQNIFAQKVYKIPVSVVDNCPNRMGLKGMQTCVFCDVWGSAANAEAGQMDLASQIKKYRAFIQKKYKAQAFLVYFQAYTNTFTKIDQLRANLEIALSEPNVVGLVIGTRPDCVSPAVLSLWQEFAKRTKIFVELGAQSFNDEQLLFLRRGHTHLQTLKAIEKITAISEIDLGIHLIFGNPGESSQDVLKTALAVNEMPVSNVKLHNLHVLKDTGLESLYAQGKFAPDEFENYAQKVQVFLENLSPRIFIQRLAAYAPRWEELIAPKWTADRMKTHQEIIDWLRHQQSYQSKALNLASESEQILASKLRQNSTPKGQFKPLESLRLS